MAPLRTYCRYCLVSCFIAAFRIYQKCIPSTAFPSCLLYPVYRACLQLLPVLHGCYLWLVPSAVSTLDAQVLALDS